MYRCARSLWLALVAALALSPAASIAQDSDNDTIPDVLDKCMLDSRNFDFPCDTDQDGYGNVCDGDFNQTMTVNSADYSMFFVPAFIAQADPTGRGFDMNCNGVFEGDPNASGNGVDYNDFFLPQWQIGVPGPSGLACAGTIPCL